MVMTTNRTVTRAVRVFRSPSDQPHRLEYMATRIGHRVVHCDPRESAPVAYLFDTIDEARLLWALTQQQIEKSGYKRA